MVCISDLHVKVSGDTAVSLLPYIVCDLDTEPCQMILQDAFREPGRTMSLESDTFEPSKKLPICGLCLQEY